MAIWWFFVPALALTALIVALVALGLRRGARVRGAETGERREMRIYADQLKEIDRDRARGAIAPDEAERLRAETARRLLDADRRTVAPMGESPRAMRLVALGLILAVPLGATLLYAREGAVLYPDQPLVTRHTEAVAMRAGRPSQAVMQAEWEADPARPAAPEVDAQYLALMTQLRQAMQERPLDTRGLRLLAVNEANLGNHAAAAEAWSRLIALEGAEDPAAVAVTDLAALAEAMVLASGGRISPEADLVLERLLGRDPANGTGRYYLGLMFAQTGRPDLTFRLWRGLLEDSAPGDPWVPAIRGTIGDLAAVAGVRYTLPPLAAGGRGPSAEDIADAAGLSAEDRAARIGGMVEGLAARLANQGGSAEEWAQLIGALGVLGQTERARAIWAEARLVFADQAAGLAQVDAAARAAGFGE